VTKRPPWWSWEIEFTPHVLKRMIDRGFTEVDVRRMIDDATDVEPSIETGRWNVTSRHDRRLWILVLEPDEIARVVLVITAYRPSTS
jgi:hypothetical protein